MPNEFDLEVSTPFLSKGSDQDLSVDSTLAELPLYEFQVETSYPSLEVAKIFEKYPLLPGAILVEQGHLIGAISRRRLLELLIRPYGLELLQKPLNVLYSYARTQVLLLPSSTPILTATQQALRRSPELLADPVVVKTESQAYKLLDVQELHMASWQLRGIETQVRYERSQAQIIQTNKMASLGHLVDGIAHEILDPVGFIWGNLAYIATYSEQLLQLVSAYEAHSPPDKSEIAQMKEEIEFDFLQRDLPLALRSIRTGAKRLKKLATSLQNFCHIDEIYPKPADLHACLDSILLLINSRLNGEIEIVKSYGHLPPVVCFIGELNQVFMNVLSHAVDALLDRAVRCQLATESTTATVDKARIEITTKVCSRAATDEENPDSRWVSIRIADNGPSMSPQVQQQVMGSFSVGKRAAARETTLSASYWIVTSRHGGQLKLRSPIRVVEETPTSNIDDSEAPPGIGTEFEILLPLV